MEAKFEFVAVCGISVARTKVWHQQLILDINVYCNNVQLVLFQIYLNKHKHGAIKIGRNSLHSSEATENQIEL